MPSVLPGFVYDRQLTRFRDTSTGRFVGRARIANLLERQVARAEDRLGNIVQSLYAKETAPGYAQVLMRDEVRRLTLQNAALGRGGFDRLTFADYGRAGRSLRDTYQRMTNLVNDLQAGRATLPQALQRIRGYVGDARKQFYIAQREAQRASGRRFEERRRLNPAEHCRDCVRWASMGWQELGVLPPPSEESACGSRCRCTMESRELTEQMERERSEVQTERIFA